MSLAESMLEAASTLKAPFTPEALLLAAWQADPVGFGLPHYQRTHPDARKVNNVLYGSKGLIRRGLLTLEGGLLALSGRGLGVVQVAEAKGAAPEGLLLRLLPLLGSVAAEKYADGRKNVITFAEACSLWGIARGDDVDARLAAFGRELHELERHVGREALLPGGRVVTAGEVRCLQHLHEHLGQRYERHLGLLRDRKGQL